jgi:hypothetical protein
MTSFDTNLIHEAFEVMNESTILGHSVVVRRGKLSKIIEVEYEIEGEVSKLVLYENNINSKKISSEMIFKDHKQAYIITSETFNDSILKLAINDL